MKRAKIILRFLGGLIIFMAAVESCARLDDFIAYGAPFWGPYNVERLYERDRIGQRGRPGARYKKWQLNSLGYRSPEPRSDSIHVVCFGASETFGLFEEDGEEYPRQLERNLNARIGKNTLQVVNVAYAGETIATSTLRVPEIVKKIHPRFAFIYPSPAYYIWLPWILAPTNAAAPEESHYRFDFRVADRLRAALKSSLPKRAQAWLSQRDINLAVAGFQVMDRVPEENVLRYRTDLAALVDALRTRGVEPILVTHADPFGEHPVNPDYQLLTTWRRFYPMLTDDGFIDMEQRMNDAMRSLATGQHIQLIDAAREIPPSREYFADFCHFTTRGAGLMASHLADEFSSENELVPSHDSAALQTHEKPVLPSPDAP
jgi:lysophospholipase L1-like esterase